jgi:hypothetical protein
MVGDQVLDPQPRPRPVQVSGHRSRGRSMTSGQLGGARPANLVREQHLAIRRGQPLDRVVDEADLHAQQQFIVGSRLRRPLAEQIRVPAIPVHPATRRPDQIPSDGHRIRRQGFSLDPVPRSHHPHQRFLDQVVNQLGIPDTGGDHPAHDRNQLDQPIVAVLLW